MANISDNAQDLLNKRYLKKEYSEKTWENISDRVSKAVSDAEKTNELKEKWHQEFYQMIENMDFIPGTPVLLNADINNPGQLSSCFIIDVQDNIESIYQAKAECAKIFQKNGGVGFNISALRPTNAMVETSKGYSCGPIGFMEEFNLTADIVTRNNIRKGAIKIDLNDWHPSIYEFIHCKDDTNKLNFMNISVSLSDKFMQAVINNEEWQLKFPDYRYDKDIYNKEWNGNIEEWESKGYPIVVYQVINAKDLYQEIMESAWRTGEPGTSFRDNMDRENPNPHLGHISSTNPCLHKDSYLVTENGLEKISRLESRIWNGHNYNDSKVWKTGIKNVVRVMTNSGYEYVTTPDHRFLLKNDEWCEAKDLIGKQIKFDLNSKEWIGYDPFPNVDYRILGFELGDATYHKASKRMKYLYVTSNKDDQVAEIVEKEFHDKFYDSDKKKTINIPNNTLYSDIFDTKIEHRLIPDWIMALPKQQMKDFLQGIFSANGCNLKKYYKIQLVSINKQMLQQIQQMLLLYGIKSKLWYHDKEKKIEFNNGVYSCKQSCHLVISRESYIKFLNEIGFIQDYKNGFLNINYKKEDSFETVILISELGEAEVWDFTETQYHQGISNGAYVHNCSEFCNIPYSSCNLGSINLINCGSAEKEVIQKLKEIVPKTVRFLDNMITVNKLPLDKIDKTTRNIRPIGLGTFGLADLLYKLKIQYNSEKGYRFIDLIYETIKESAIKSSRSLAEEKGEYPEWALSNWYKEGILIRNSCLVSIAPTGSISFLANASGGLEPNYALVMQRRTNEGDIYYIVNPILEEELKNRELYSLELLDKIYKNNGSVKGIKEIPKDLQKIFVTAYDITPEEHLKVLAIIQQHVDLSCSKTINLAKNAVVEDIMGLYLSAWEQGIKGVTVYRDGCRDNQVLSTGSTMSENNQVQNQYINIEPPLQEAYGKRLKVKTGCGSIWIKIFNDDQGEIREIFTQSSGGGCKANIETISRLVSLLLRANVDPNEVMDQLSSAFCKTSQDNVKCKSCGDVIAKEMKKFIQQEINIIPVNKNDKSQTIGQANIPIEKENGSMNCPDCGEKLIAESGCVRCNCGYSRC